MPYCHINDLKIGDIFTWGSRGIPFIKISNDSASNEHRKLSPISIGSLMDGFYRSQIVILTPKQCADDYGYVLTLPSYFTDEDFEPVTAKLV